MTAPTLPTDQRRLQAAAEALANAFGLESPGDEEMETAAAILEAINAVDIKSLSDAVLDEMVAGTRFVPQTSVQGAYDVMGRAKGQRWKLLREYARVADGGLMDGLTDEEVAERVGLERSCYWKRAGELRDLGLIEPTGDTRPGAAGSARIVCRVTDMGRQVVTYADQQGR